MNHKAFNYKAEGRIFTDTPEHIERIKEIIGDMDEFEYGYLPDDLIAVYAGSWETVHNGKFDALDLEELERRCLAEKIPCGCVIAHMDYSDDETYYRTDYKSIVGATLHFHKTEFWTLEQVLEAHGMAHIANQQTPPTPY